MIEIVAELLKVRANPRVVIRNAASQKLRFRPTIEGPDAK